MSYISGDYSGLQISSLYEASARALFVLGVDGWKYQFSMKNRRTQYRSHEPTPGGSGKGCGVPVNGTPEFRVRTQLLV